MESHLREHRQRTDNSALNDAVPGRAGGASFRVLLIDDSRDDRTIAIRDLTREFPNIHVTEVDSSAAFKQALDRGEFDLLVTDYQLFWSDGLKIIKAAKQRWMELPVIMFTGSGSEEIAVLAMKAGVYDYILKSPKDHGRLSAAARGALRKLEQSRHLALAEARYATLFDTVPVGLFRCTPRGTLLDVNPALASILEIPREELIGRNFAEVHPEVSDFQRWREHLEREGSVTWEDTRVKTARGQIRWVKIHAKALREVASAEVIYEGSVEDVTVSKQAETEKELLIAELQAALGKVRTLAGLLPICASCKKIRDEEGDWNMLETFIEDHSHAHFTHSFCPECAHRLYPEVFLDRPKF
ncbi:MAG TPA: PAS domain S-box protein [Verrucomicrobiae bacterium]|nr:PAS domain S-box protein [Verrucomicrobiae bacterium]